MLKQIYKIFLTLFSVVIIIYIVGAKKGSQIDTELEVQLPYSRDYIFSIYADIPSYPNVKKDLQNIEILEKTSNNIMSWIENYKNGTRLEYKMVGRKIDSYFDYEVYNTNTRDTSKIMTTFTEEYDSTIINLQEVGHIENKFKRGVRFLIGDKYLLKKQSKWLRVAIMQEQLDRK